MLESRKVQMRVRVVSPAAEVSLVLRFPKIDGEYVFRVAKVKPDAISSLNDQLSRGTPWEQTGLFGPALDLAQAMHEVDTRDFSVVDIEAKDRGVR
jgi:hypothetical protein